MNDPWFNVKSREGEINTRVPSRSRVFIETTHDYWPDRRGLAESHTDTRTSRSGGSQYPREGVFSGGRALGPIGRYALGPRNRFWLVPR